MISAQIATILISANQNSISPNSFTVTRFSASNSSTQASAGGDRDHIGDGSHDPAEPVRPSAEEAGPGTEQVGGEIDEGFVLQVGQQQLAHRAHHEEQHRADDQVDEDDGRAGQADGLARSHEQAGADGPADGDPAHLARGQAALEPLFTFGDFAEPLLPVWPAR
ncbi:hypothetical protein G6F50_015703 [Rhizopus delemar]|uniref:Uncharacterized protein n=1 Tax=Rhizopus delemar TaxID=936053 RepID=A0A9P7C3A9_9FUNG|nr:hypothetical protein G6F50_015703 [Rhizopus delemar]